MVAGFTDSEDDERGDAGQQEQQAELGELFSCGWPLVCHFGAGIL